MSVKLCGRCEHERLSGCGGAHLDRCLANGWATEIEDTKPGGSMAGMGNGERDNALKKIGWDKIEDVIEPTTFGDTLRQALKEKNDAYYTELDLAIQEGARQENRVEDLCVCGTKTRAEHGCMCEEEEGRVFYSGEEFLASLDDITPRHPNSARFHELLKDVGVMHDRKQADYGRGNDPFSNVRASEEWGIDGWVGAMVRAQDKIRRLQTHATRGSLVNESVQDSLIDLAVYSLIALVLYEEVDKG